jgi:pimeloyl-ACP methyl ester carboxylesterase
MDSPGTGEASSLRVLPAEGDDVIDGVFEAFAGEPMLDLAQVSVVGVSLGGNQALRCAVRDRRILSVVAVTPPYDPARWLHRASPLLRDELGMVFAEDHRDPYAQAADLSLHDVAPDVRSPVLIFGGGRDLVVPPSESQLLAARLGSLGTLSWYGGGGHCLYGYLREWTSDAATWIASVGAARAIEMQMNGRADPRQIAAMARDELSATDALEHEFFGEEDDAARAVDPDQNDLDDLGTSARIVSRHRPD